MANNHAPHIKPTPKNIIMVIADGMGPAYTSAFRYFKDDRATPIVEETIFDRHLVGRTSTYPASISGYVTDSAAAATALATGIKTYNKAISVDVNKQPVETVLEKAKKQGKKTGVVVTSRINHATPAAYLTHNESRKNYNEIADSYIDQGIKADVYFGGGWANFIRSDRNLVAEFKQAGFQYINSYRGLDSLDPTKPVIGLFNDYSLGWAIDDVNQHRLTSMVQSAIKQLSNDNGFFMLVEASLIDWAGHDNDIAVAMHEIQDLATAMLFLESYVNQHPDTLVILTADHSTGGLTIGAEKDYRWQPEMLVNLPHSPQAIAKKLQASERVDIELANKLMNIKLTENEFQQLNEVPKYYQKAYQSYVLLSDEEKSRLKKQYKGVTLEKFYRAAIMKIIDKRTNTGWTTEGHTAIDVPVFAFGPQSELFRGQLDNTDIAKKILTLLGK